MFKLFRENKSLQKSPVDKDPFPVKTEREKAVEEKVITVFRSFYVRR